jgi:amino acid adenylation domain-containing protein
MQLNMMNGNMADQGLVALPASSVQQRFWVLDQLNPRDPAVNIAVRFGLRGSLNVDALTRALNETVKRHETLRSNFAMVDGEVKQIVTDCVRLDLPVTDLRNLPEAERRDCAERLASGHARATFDLAKDTLVRAALLRILDEEHMLLINVHHSVADGWSIGIITDELGMLYEAFCTGTAARLAELPIQYADYTIWQQEQQNEAGPGQSEAYWKRQLTGMEKLEVPADFARPAAEYHSEANILSRLLPVPLTDSLRRLSVEHDATLFMTMLAGLQVLLHRYTGETDIAVGTQVVGRNVPEVESLIGPFINTLVLRTDLSGDPSFENLLNRARETATEALEHQEVPLERVAELLRAKREGGNRAMFNVNFIFQRDFVKPWNHAGVEMWPIPSRSPGALHDLNVFLVERKDGWRLSCEYNTALFRAERITRMLGHLETLLESVANDPAQKISHLPLLNDVERTQLLREWNATQAAYPAGGGVHRLIEAQAERTPGATAVVHGGASVSYRTLNERANQLARTLQEQGTRPGSLIGICLDRTPEMIIAALAVWKTGCAYVPLDPEFPPTRLAYMASDAKLAVLITSASRAPLIETSAPIVLVDSKRIAAKATTNPDLAVGGDETAYVLYTSGSTGRPKGVAIAHAALANLLQAIVREPGVSSRDAIAAVTTLSFDIAALELYAPLITGGRVILLGRKQGVDGAALRRVIEEGAATILQATPATWRMLIESGWTRTPRLKMLCGGEPLTRDLADELLARGGELWNMYGPTETTIWSSWVRIRNDGEPISIGRPAPNTQFYVLDGNLQPVPAGVSGELFIGGAGVAKGYLDRPELTAERFLQNPFGEGRIYRTGDRARFRFDGQVELLGRTDRQVKIRGYRIELGEVEAALSGSQDVRDAAVVVRPDAVGEVEMIGYFVPVHAGVTSESIRAQLKRHLPDYMVPGLLIPLAELPKTPNQKTDRNALPDPGTLRTTSKSESEPGASVDPLEATLTAIWEKVLRIRPIGRGDNFFELGGHSVLAAQMFSRMERSLGKALPLATLFQAPTIAQLASLLRDGGWTPPWSALVPIRPSGSKPPIYLVHPIGGNIINLAGFGSRFDLDQPLYGLQARGLDGEETPHTSVETMARDYVQQIRAIQPEGPYLLGGFSAGGIVAYEMAQQLTSAGETVQMLALLDTVIQVPEESRALNRKWARWLRTIRFNSRYALRVGPCKFAALKLRNWKMRANIRLWLGNRRKALNVEEAFLVAVRDYSPKPYAGTATLFRSQDELDIFTDKSLGWSPLIQGGLSIRLVSGDHDTILSEPHIGVLAREISSSLKESTGLYHGLDRQPSGTEIRSLQSLARFA